MNEKFTTMWLLPKSHTFVFPQSNSPPDASLRCAKSVHCLASYFLKYVTSNGDGVILNLSCGFRANLNRAA